MLRSIKKLRVAGLATLSAHQQPQESAGSVLKNDHMPMLQLVEVLDADPPLQIFGIRPVVVGTVTDGMAHQDGELVLIEF